MKLAYFLFLSVAVAMGQTTALTGPTTLAPHSLVENSATDTFYIPRCSDLITYGKTTKAVKDMFPEECAPKLESAEPSIQSGQIPHGPAHADSIDWQAIADHCHIETLVHHRSANETMGATSPPGEIMPTNPEPDTWEAVTGMRIVCK